MGIQVTSYVPVITDPYLQDEDDFKVKSDEEKNVVELTVNGRQYRVDGYDLIIAVKNCLNTGEV